MLAMPAAALAPSAPAPRVRGSAACEAERSATAGRGRARDARATGACAAALPTPAPAPAELPAPAFAPPIPSFDEKRVPERGERADRHQRGERLAVPAKLGAVVAAALAVLHVEAGRARHLPEPLGRLGELQVDLVAGQVAALACVGQGHAGPDQERLDRGDRRVHRDRDLLVGEGVDLAQEQRAPLRLGQPLDVQDERPELSALLDLLRNRGAVLVRVDVHRVLALRHGLAKVVEAAVAGDAVEPRPRVDRAVVGQDRLVGGDVDLLEDVLGVLGRGEHSAAEGKEPHVVAVDERFEGPLLPGPDHRDEPLVPLELEQGRTSAKQPDTA